MKLILEIWGSEMQLALGEFRGLMEGEKLDYKILEIDYPVVVVEVEDHKPLVRAGLLRRVSKYLYSGDNIPHLNINLENYAIKVRGKGKEKVIEGIAKGIQGSVNLSFPENIIMSYIKSKIYVGIELFYINSKNFEKRRSKNLPISYPITMHPRLARAMINMARVKPGDKVLDPFCGTGIILIEAGLIELIPYGSDISDKMIEASKINLKKFKISASIEKKDVGEINGEYDAIITDPPYGRSASTSGEETYNLYQRAFKAFSGVTSKVVIALPDKRALKLGEEYFNLVEFYPHRVHKSLTRYFAYFHS